MMALPTKNTSWPPQALAPVYDRIDLWSAWYSGDPDLLQAALGGSGVQTGVNVFGEKIPKSRAGVINRVAGWFWSKPKPQAASQDVMLHIPVASDIAAMSADILFGEPPNLILPADPAVGTQARLDTYIKHGLWTDIREGAEVGSALGGVYLRVVWDSELRDHPWLQAVHPDIAVPEFRWGQLAAVTFWDEILIEASGKTVRHLERHEPGVILHGVYEGTRTELGHAVPLTDYEETAGFVEQDDWDPELSGIETGVGQLTAVYVPNVRPNRIWRNVPEAVYWGRSDFQGIEQPMDRLDMVWSSWMRDIRLGLARLVVPQSALQTFGPGQGAFFDLDKELLVGLDLTLGPDESSITQVQFAIRTDDHERTADKLLEVIVRDAGYSIESFTGQESKSESMTATEVTARRSRTGTTRSRKIGYWSTALSQALQVLLAVDIAKFGPDSVDPVEPTIEFPDEVSTPPDVIARTVQMLDAAKAVSRKTKVAMVHPDWTQPQIDAEAELIGNETPALPVTVPDPFGVNAV